MKVIDCARAVERGKDRDLPEEVAEIDGYRILRDGGVGITQIPGEVVHVAEYMTTRARRLSVARKPRGVVEHGPPLDHRLRLRIRQGRLPDLLLRGQRDHLHRVVEAGHDI